MTVHIQHLAQKIEDQLTSGILLKPDVVHHIESMTGAASPDDLADALQDADSDDMQTLIELIFYPDEAQQEQLEPDIEKAAPDARAAAEVEKRLICRMPLHTRLIFPDGNQTGPVEAPEHALRQFTRRLNMARLIPEAICASLQSHIGDASTAIGIKVKLRNCRFAFSDNIISFLCTYFAHMPTEAPDYSGRLSFALDVLDEIVDKSDIYFTLMERKRHCAEMIRMADDSAKQLREIPVEALIMKGVSIPCISVEEARRRIDMIDEIAIRVYGRTEMLADLMAEGQNSLNLGVFKGRQDIDKVIKILS